MRRNTERGFQFPCLGFLFSTVSRVFLGELGLTLTKVAVAHTALSMTTLRNREKVRKTEICGSERKEGSEK